MCNISQKQNRFDQVAENRALGVCVVFHLGVVQVSHIGEFHVVTLPVWNMVNMAISILGSVRRLRHAVVN